MGQKGHERSMSKTFFISDLHLGHEKIIEYCQRPFGDVHEMDDALIGNWNRTVGPDDTVYHLGDLCFTREQAERYLGRLNGRIHLLPGNHDVGWFGSYGLKSGSGHDVHYLPEIAELEFMQYSRDEKWPRTVVLCHYPMASWNKKTHGAWHLYGHVHNNPKPDGFGLPDIGLAINVGVDCLPGYAPINLERLAVQLEEQEERRGMRLAVKDSQLYLEI